VKVDGDSDDEGVACETYGAAILEALGAERRAEVLARLYLVRTDVQYAVRNGALHVWKTLVVNTPKTLQEILPALMTEVIAALADESEGGGPGGGSCWNARKEARRGGIIDMSRRRLYSGQCLRRLV
jgi:hypothetical protein